MFSTLRCAICYFTERFWLNHDLNCSSIWLRWTLTINKCALAVLLQFPLTVNSSLSPFAWVDFHAVCSRIEKPDLFAIDKQVRSHGSGEHDTFWSSKLQEYIIMTKLYDCFEAFNPKLNTFVLTILSLLRLFKSQYVDIAKLLGIFKLHCLYYLLHKRENIPRTGVSILSWTVIYSMADIVVSEFDRPRAPSACSVTESKHKSHHRVVLQNLNIIENIK